MKAVIQILIVILLCLPLKAGANLEPELEFLNNLINITENLDGIETIITVQHHQDKNCTLQHWNPHEIPIIRLNELAFFGVRRFFNRNLLSLVCIDGDLDHTLLNALARTLENLRQQRIILWTQRKPSREFLEDIVEQAVRLRFFRTIIVSMDDNPKGVLSVYRFHSFPSPRFTKVKNNSKLKSQVFPGPRFNYKGFPAIVKTFPSNFSIPVKTKSGFFPISRGEDMEVVEFARKYNLDLKLYDENASDHFDIQLGPQFVRRGDIFAQGEVVNPSSTASLLVVVPCNHQRSMKDFLRELDLLTWLLCLLPVYGTFVLVESLVLVVTYRMTGEPHRLTNLNPFLNLRAFRAILGLPFPELRRTSLSLRQLSLAITIFGFIFSNCLNCKLSAMLTTPLQRPQVTDFEELRASGLTTIMDDYVHSFIENNIDPQFFNHVIPKFIILKSVDRLNFIFSLNESYSYIIYTTNWPNFQKFLQSIGKMNHCTSKDLIIAQNLPRMYAFERNSKIKWLLSRFVMYLHEAGIREYWNKGVSHLLMKSFNVTVQRNSDTGPVPLCVQQLKCLWYVLVIGNCLASVVFLVEIFLKRRRDVRQQEAPV